MKWPMLPNATNAVPKINNVLGSGTEVLQAVLSSELLPVGPAFPAKPVQDVFDAGARCPAASTPLLFAVSRLANNTALDVVKSMVKLV
jgi:hypothetical protein